MPARFAKVRYHAFDPAGGRGLESLEGLAEALAAPAGLPGSELANDEAAARYYLDRLFGRSGLEAVRSLQVSDRHELVPDLRLESIQAQPLTGTRLVRFEQTSSGVPIYGAQVLVELDASGGFVSNDTLVTEAPGDVSPIASLSPKQALVRIERYTRSAAGSLLTAIRPPELFYYQDDAGAWHLAWYFARVPAAPPGFGGSSSGATKRGRQGAPRPEPADVGPAAQVNYLVDAHSGEILHCFSAVRSLGAADALPTGTVQCQGIDEDGVVRSFVGSPTAGGYKMDDPLRRIRTFDLGYAPWRDAALPATPASAPTSDWATIARAAVSAHVNVALALDFYRENLKRDSVDGKGMALITVVNCTESVNNQEMRNAYWCNDRLWFGQVKDSTGRLRSLAGHLDVVSHELTHGVTEKTAGLDYYRQAGALDESFSDIFGVIIRNWYEHGTDVSDWAWEIGQGQGDPGQPFRDMADPGRIRNPLSSVKGAGTFCPATMADYFDSEDDHGGVHVNNNIHNKAAYNLLTVGDEHGQRVFTPLEVARLYLLALIRLSRTAVFADALEALLAAAASLYAADAIERTAKLATIRAAYAAVGITETA